jgi:flagellar motor switch protein FliN/FliY
MIEPIRDLLYSAMQSDQLSTDRRWIIMLRKQLKNAEVEITAQLATHDGESAPDSPMKVGDIIPLDIPDKIVALVDDVPLMECRYGQQGGQYALKIDRFMASENAEASSGRNQWLRKQTITRSGNDDAEDDWAAAMAEQAMAEGSRPTASAQPPISSRVSMRNKTSMMNELDMILDIPVQISVELGRTKITIKNLLQLAHGSVVELDAMAGEPLNVFVNGTLIAQGEVVVVNDKFGIRLTDIVTPSERARKIGH